MKRKLIALLVASTLLGGVGTTAFAAESNENVTPIVLSSENNVESTSNIISLNSEEGKSDANTYSRNLSENNKPQGFFRLMWYRIKTIFININDFIYGIFNGNNSENNGSPNNNVNGGDVVNKPQETPQGNNGNINQGGNNQSEEIAPPSNEPSKPEIKPEPKPEQKPEVTPSSNNKPETSNPIVTPPSNNGSNQESSDNFMAQVEQIIFQKVNEERAKAGVPQLSYNNTMQKYARIKSKDMGDRGYFDHADPEGKMITEQMKKDGVRYNAWGENIAYIGGNYDDSSLANQFMNTWMNSSGHRANILSTNFNSIGVGVYKIGNKVYATQEFYR